MAKGTTEKKQGTFSKLIGAYRMTRKREKYIGLLCLAVFLVVGGIFGALLWFLIHWLAGVITGISMGLMATMLVFARRAEKAAYAQFEGQPGGAAAALGVLRRGWQVQQAVAVTKSQDLVHRVVGRPGVILVGEGNPARIKHLLAVERKKHARVVGETPIYDIVAGGEPGAVPVSKLAKHVMKLPRNIQPADVTDVLQRLKALDAMRPQLPVPKGPMPTSMKQARSTMRGR